MKSETIKRAITENELFQDEEEYKGLIRNINIPPRLSLANLPSTRNNFPPISRSAIKQQLRLLKDAPEKEYGSKLNLLISRITPTNLNFSGEILKETGKLPKIALTERESNSKMPNILNIQKNKKELKKTSFITRAGFKTRFFGKSDKGFKSFTIIKPEFKNTKGYFLFTVGEGLGPHAHLISSSLKLNFTSILGSLFSESFSTDSILPVLSSIDKSVLKFLESQTHELNFSGCSLCTVLVFGSKLFISNIGTCGAVIAKYSKTFDSQEMIPRHNFNNKQEIARVKNTDNLVTKNKSGETVMKLGNKGPELEHSRALGYYVGCPGILNQSEIKEYELKSEDKFIILASGEVWKILGYQEAVELCIEGYMERKTDLCCNAIIKECEKRLIANSKRIHDISVIVFFINGSN